ncbi:phage portal protein [Rhodobacteraceae bacterium CCMM004]|nr:phage portal protein [Rhodobacteraceae bacterium CCMM004]
MPFQFLPALLRPSKPATARERRFDAAAGGRRGTGMGTFQRINPEVGAAAVQVRSRARYLANNNPWVNQGVANWVGSLVGTGIVPAPRHADAKTRSELTEHWRAFTDEADADQRTDFEGLQADVTRSLVVDGEAFIQVVATDRSVRLRLLPCELVDESLTRELRGGGYIVQGVEFDAEGTRVAYHVLSARPTSLFDGYAPAVRVPADQILHVMKPLAAGQVRGVSWLAPIILPVSEFDQLCDALLVGCKVAAMSAGFIVNQNDLGDGSDPFEDGASLEPGALIRLPGGYDVRFNSPTQASETASFIALNLRQLAAGLGLPDHMVSGDLSNANYSSLRAGLLPFRQRVEQIQYGTLVPQFLNPVWQKVVTLGVHSGDLAAPDFETNPRGYATDWLPPRPMQVDPLKDTQATIAELEAGLTSRRKAVAERGWSLEDLDAELALEKEKPGDA